MANDWTYRRKDVYWQINQETRLMRRVANQGTTAISAPLEYAGGLRRWNVQRYGYTSRIRTRNQHYAANFLARPVALPVGAIEYTQGVDGAVTPGAVVPKVINKNVGGGFT